MKIQVIFIASILSTFVSYSQVQYGLKGGLNLATLRYIGGDNSKARLGFNAGGFAEVPVLENLFIRPELLYSSKGYAYPATQNSQSGSLRLNYLNLPILFGFRPTTKSTIFAGPELGFLVKAVSKSQGFSTDMTSFYRHFDVGFDVGASYNFNQFLGVEGRYNYGFKDLVNGAVVVDGNVVSQFLTGANSVLQFGFYYYLSK